MKKYQELTIKDSLDNLRTIINKLAEEITPYKVAKRDSERYAKMLYKNKGDVICLKTRQSTLYESTIWIALIDNELRVTNITSRHSLNVDKYNHILTTFTNLVIDKIKSRTTNIQLSKAEPKLEDLMTQESLIKFNNWFDLCDGETLISHPNDYNRWLEFIYCCFKNNDKITSSDIAKYMIEDKGYEEDEINQLCSLFDFGIDLLKKSND